MNIINERVKQVFEESGLSRTAFADSINTTVSFMYHCLRGKSVPKRETLYTISQVYGVDYNWLSNGQPPPQSRRRKGKVTHLDLILEDLRKYNADNGTRLSYGEYKAQIRLGKIKPVFHSWDEYTDWRRYSDVI